MTARFGYYPPRPLRSLLTPTPEERLAIQDSPEFKRLMEEYYTKFPYMRTEDGDVDNNNLRLSSFDGGDSGLAAGGQPGTAEIEDETADEFFARMRAKEIEPVHHMPADTDNEDYFEMF